MKKLSVKFVLFFVGIFTTCMLMMSTTLVKPNDGKPVGKPWPCPEKYSKMTSPVKPQEGILSTGKDLWNQHCKSCHGKNGKGDGTKADKLDISCGDFTTEEYLKKSDGELFFKTSEGRKPMPSYKSKLSETEIWSVVLYTKTFGKK